MLQHQVDTEEARRRRTGRPRGIDDSLWPGRVPSSGKLAGTQNLSKAAASMAQPAPKPNAASGLKDCHSQPNSSDAGSSIRPAVRLNQP